MAKNLLRRYNTEQEYEENKCSFSKDTVYAIMENDNVHYAMGDSYLIAMYDVTTISEPIQIFRFTHFDSNQISKMYVDEIETEVTSAYTFNTIGEHKVKCTFECGALTNLNRLFYKVNCCVGLDISNLDTSNVTDMSGCFAVDNDKLKKIIGIEKIDTSKVKLMSGMFQKCYSLTSLDLSNFDTSNVTNMSYMFNNCSGLTSLDVSNFNTSNVTDMSFTFQNCYSLTSLDVSNFDTSNVINMKQLFYNCQNILTLDVSNFDTSKVTNMKFMFGADATFGDEYEMILTSLDVSNFDTSNVTDMYCMFQKCSSLTSLDVSNFDTSNVTNMSYMFNKCSSLTSLDVSNFDTSNVTDMVAMFQFCTNLISLNASNFNLSKIPSADKLDAAFNLVTTINPNTVLQTLDLSNSVPPQTTFDTYSDFIDLPLSTVSVKLNNDYKTQWETVISKNACTYISHLNNIKQYV